MDSENPEDFPDSLTTSPVVMILWELNQRLGAKFDSPELNSVKYALIFPSREHVQAAKRALRDHGLIEWKVRGIQFMCHLCSTNQGIGIRASCH